MPRFAPARPRLGTMLALWGALACNPTQPVTPGGPAGATPAASGPGATTDVAPVTRMAEMLPPTTAMVWEIAGPDRIAAVLDRDALVTKFEPQYRMIAQELVRATGRDLLDPKVLADIGIDTGGRLGLALRPGGGAIAFATLKDRGRFRGAVFEIAANNKVELAATPLGHAEILRLNEKNGPAIVIREPYVAFVIPTFQEREQEHDTAFELATMDPHASLAATKGYRKATGGLAPSDAMAYVDVAAFSRDAIASMTARASKPEAGNWARDELAKARADKATPERIAELEQQARQIDENNARWARRQAGERELFEALLGGVQTSVWTADAKPSSVVGQGTTTFTADSPLLLAFENGTGSPPLARALDGRPLFLVTGKADLDAFVRVVDLFARAEGTTWAEAAAEVAAATGIDLDKDLRPLLTGVAGFAITRDGDDKVAIEDAKDIGAAVHVEVHDPKRARELLAKAAKVIDGKEGVKVRKAGNGWVVDVPKWRKLYADVEGPHLVVATDAKLVGRIASGAAGTVTKRAGSAALAAASMRDAAAGVLFDPELGLLFFGFREFALPMPSSTETPEDAKVPKSRAWKAKEREIVAVDAKIEAAQRERSKVEIESFRAVLHPWGSLGANARRDGDTLVVQGGWFMRAETIAAAVASSLAAVRKLDERSSSSDLGELFEARRKLELELHEIRRADIEKFRARKPR